MATDSNWLPDIGPSLYQNATTDLARTYRLSFGTGLTATLDAEYDNGTDVPKGRVTVTADAATPFVSSVSSAFSVVDGELRVHPSNEVQINGGVWVGHVKTDDEAATTGAVRLAVNGFVRARNGALDANVDLIGLDGSDVVQVGDGTNGAGLDLNAPNTSKPIRIRIGGSTVATWASDSLRFAGTAATTGLIRFPNDAGLAWRDSGNSRNIVARVDNNDDMVFGRSDNELHDVSTGGKYSYAINSVEEASLSRAGATTTWLGTAATVFEVKATNSLQLSAGAGIVVIDAQTGAGDVYLQSAGTTKFRINGTGIGFYSATPAAKPTVTGSRGGNVALADLLTKLATLGLITDGSS